MSKEQLRKIISAWIEQNKFIKKAFIKKGIIRASIVRDTLTDRIWTEIIRDIQTENFKGCNEFLKHNRS